MLDINEVLNQPSMVRLKRTYETNPQHPTLVVVVTQDGGIDYEETKRMHETFLIPSAYFEIPVVWETEQFENLSVVHLSEVAEHLVRRHPFSITPMPVAPNSWLVRLPQERFEMLLLVQELYHIYWNPDKDMIANEIKPALESDELSDFWANIERILGMAKKLTTPKGEASQMVLEAWTNAKERIFYKVKRAQVCSDQEFERIIGKDGNVTINTGGGAYVKRPVNLSGGDFVGRDLIIESDGTIRRT